MLKNKKPEDINCTGISRIRYKVWDKDRHYYLGSKMDYAWWMVRDARKFIRTDISNKSRNLEIHQVEEITILKERVVMK